MFEFHSPIACDKTEDLCLLFEVTIWPGISPTELWNLDCNNPIINLGNSKIKQSTWLILGTGQMFAEFSELTYMILDTTDLVKAVRNWMGYLQLNVMIHFSQGIYSQTFSLQHWCYGEKRLSHIYFSLFNHLLVPFLPHLCFMRKKYIPSATLSHLYIIKIYLHVSHTQFSSLNSRDMFLFLSNVICLTCLGSHAQLFSH